MSELFRSLVEYLGDNWPELLWITAAAGFASYFAGRRSRRLWQNRDFLNRLNVSLTRIDHGVLKIRTILEMDCEAIFLNASAAKTIVKLARKTTADNPLLPIPDSDCWQYLNAVLNEISERFALGQIKNDLGMETISGTYLLCLTCERAGPVRTQKVRAMLVQKPLLLRLPEAEPTYESPTHVTRWHTLQQLAALYQNHPNRFIEIELSV